MSGCGPINSSREGMRSVSTFPTLPTENNILDFHHSTDLSERERIMSTKLLNASIHAE